MLAFAKEYLDVILQKVLFFKLITKVKINTTNNIAKH